jgi:hypothetical protein
MANCNPPLLGSILRHKAASHLSWFPCDTALKEHRPRRNTVEMQVLETSSHRTVETGDMSTISIGEMQSSATRLYTSSSNSITSFVLLMDTSLNEQRLLVLLTVELQVPETSSHRTIETGDMSTNCKGNSVTLATLLYASTLSSLTSFEMSMP